MDIKYYDIGLNLFCRQFKHPDKVLQRAAEAGVACILTGSDPEENRMIDRYLKKCEGRISMDLLEKNSEKYGGHVPAKHVEKNLMKGEAQVLSGQISNDDLDMGGGISRSRPGFPVYGTAGLHPHNADRFMEAHISEVCRIYTENRNVVAIGECGLDYDRMFSTKQNQLKALEKFVALAEELSAPMFLHERDAAEDFVSVFKNVPKVAEHSVVHCFTGNRKTAEKYIEMGFSIGVTGWICDDRRADELREAAYVIPKDRILVETDAPYLTPRNVPGLGRTNVPENIIYVVRTLAEYTHISEEELIRCARENTERVFGLKEKNTQSVTVPD